METKTPEEIQKYSVVFWKRYRELPEYDKIVKNIERGEEQIRQKELSIELIDLKCQNKKFYDDLDFNHNIYSKFRSRFYSIDHDKYLIFASYKFGYGNWYEVRLGIKKEDSFEFDDYFKSRTEAELNKRMASLLKVIKAELDHEDKKKEYRIEEERTLARLGGKVAFKNLTDGSNGTIDDEKEDNHAIESEVEEISGFKDDGRINKDLKASKENMQVKDKVAKTSIRKEASSDLKPESHSNLVKRKPEKPANGAFSSSAANGTKTPNEQAKQKTLTSFFAGPSPVQSASKN
jgi:hypothetical protein